MASAAVKLAMMSASGTGPAAEILTGSSSEPATSPSPAEEVEGAPTDKYVTAAHVSAIGAIAVAALVSGGLSYFFVASYLVDAMSVLLIILGPVVAAQKVKLRKLGSFRSVHNDLRRQINTVHGENAKLTSSVDRLTAESAKLDQVRQDLDRAAQQSGASVDRLVHFVGENGRVQKEILQQLQAEVLQQIMTAVLATDADRDFIVDPPEVEVLIVRLRNLPGVEFDEKAFRQLLQQTEPPGQLTLADVCALTRLLQDQTQTMVRSTVSRQAVFASSPSPRKRIISPRGGGGADGSSSKTPSPRGGGDFFPEGAGAGAAAAPSIFRFKPRSFLQKKKVLGLF